MMGRQPGQRVGPQWIRARPTALGEAIEELRYKAHLTQRELADLSRVSLRTIKAIAAGDGYSGRRVLSRLDHALPGLQDRAAELRRREVAAAQKVQGRRGRSKAQRGSILHH